MNIPFSLHALGFLSAFIVVAALPGCSQKKSNTSSAQERAPKVAPIDEALLGIWKSPDCVKIGDDDIKAPRPVTSTDSTTQYSRDGTALTKKTYYSTFNCEKGSETSVEMNTYEYAVVSKKENGVLSIDATITKMEIVPLTEAAAYERNSSSSERYGYEDGDWVMGKALDVMHRARNGGKFDDVSYEKHFGIALVEGDFLYYGPVDMPILAVPANYNAPYLAPPQAVGVGVLDDTQFATPATAVTPVPTVKPLDGLSDETRPTEINKKKLLNRVK